MYSKITVLKLALKFKKKRKKNNHLDFFYQGPAWRSSEQGVRGGGAQSCSRATVWIQSSLQTLEGISEFLEMFWGSEKANQ